MNITSGQAKAEAVIEMARAAKRPANEPLTGRFTGPLTARFYLCLLLGR